MRPRLILKQYNRIQFFILNFYMLKAIYVKKKRNMLKMLIHLSELRVIKCHFNFLKYINFQFNPEKRLQRHRYKSFKGNDLLLNDIIYVFLDQNCRCSSRMYLLNIFSSLTVLSHNKRSFCERKARHDKKKEYLFHKKIIKEIY